MKKFGWIGIILIAFVACGLTSCAKKAANSQQAIEQSKSMNTADEQVKYLTAQANAFLNSKEYQEAINTAN